MRNFNKVRFGDVVSEFNKSKQILSEIQAQLQTNPQDHTLLVLESEALSNFSKVSSAYEKFLHQKSKITWLRLGGSGTGYFHAVMKSRMVQSRIFSFMDNGVRIDDFQEVVSHFLDHFTSYMGSNIPVTSRVVMKYIKMGSCLSVDQQLNLIKPFSNKEIKDAMFSIGNNKSPGFDRFNSGFFKQSWNLVHEDVCAAIREFTPPVNSPGPSHLPFLF